MSLFKQNTAYGRRISDWSSEVCSSDLIGKQVSQRPRRPSIAILPTADDQGFGGDACDLIRLHIAKSLQQQGGGFRVDLHRLHELHGHPMGIAALDRVTSGDGCQEKLPPLRPA